MYTKIATPAIRIMLKPLKAVIATRYFKKKEFQIAPVSLSFTIATEAKTKCPTKSVECTISSDEVTGKQPRCFINQTLASKDFASPFWYIKDVPDAADANCKFEKITLQDSAGEYTVVSKIIVNSKAIKKGDEIVVYRPAAEEKPAHATQLMPCFESKAMNARVD